MARTKTKNPQALAADEAALEERRARNAAEREQADADLRRLEAEKMAALRDGAAGRERARGLIPAILAQHETLTLLDQEARLIDADALTVRARQEAAALRTVEHEACALVKRLAEAAVGVDKALDAVRAEVAGFAEALERLLDLTAEISPPPAATEALGRWYWPDTIAECVGRVVFEIRGRSATVLPLGQAGQRFADRVRDPQSIIAGLAAHLRRPEVLARRFPSEPTLAEAVRQVLAGPADAQGGEHDDAQAHA